MKRVLCIIVTLFCLSGCGQKIEMSELGIVSGFGIDKLETGYRLTAQIVNPSAIAGNQHDTLAVFSISAEGETLFEAFNALNTLTSKVLYLPHLSVIVVNEELAKDGINHVLDFVLRNVTIRPNIALAIANNASAEDVLHVLVPSEQIPIKQLDSLSNLSSADAGTEVNYNLYQVSGMVNSESANIVLNSVAIIGDGIEEGERLDNVLQIESDTQLQINELAVFNSDKLVGYLNSEESQYYNLLVGGNKHYVVTDLLDDEYKLSYELRASKVEIKPNIDENKVSIDCEVNGILMENEYSIDLLNPDNIAVLQTYLE
ncbi:MAG: Ger(x)C family spore germination protein [Turicibacter sp.]|nr:Ger(x)C family spore germination protein [Turicibacter sp.]